MDPLLISQILLGLTNLIVEMTANWGKTDYQPVLSQDLQKAINELRALPKLPVE